MYWSEGGGGEHKCLKTQNHSLSGISYLSSGVL